MGKFIEILSQVITEQKRYKFEPEVYQKIHDITNKLWSEKDTKYNKKTFIDKFVFTFPDRQTKGAVTIYVNPRLPYIGYQGIKPKSSRDPMDLFIEVNPKKYESKKNLYLTLYHEMLHATDPTQSYLYSPKYQLTYDEKSDEKYWGHPIEFRAISNEFLEGFVLEIKRRLQGLRNKENKKHLIKSIDNLLDYFSRGTKLTKLSSDILSRINDENVLDTKVSKMLSDFTTNFPSVAEFFAERNEKPYFLNYVELIRKFNPEIWKRFLKMFYHTAEELKQEIVQN